ncbi:MAG: riboflavin kinase/FMN adenylyltransferase [Myxococcota bacterium]|jgi:riboflavin kinase/FMN adenylyltransferase
MPQPQIFAGSAQYPPATPQPVVTIGNFDGVHRGHRQLLTRLRERAAQLDAPSCVYTFEPPPRVLLAPKQRSPRIMPWTEKIRLLGEAGIDQVVVERFTRAFAQHPPDWFLQEILQQRLRARALVVGYDFRFGRARGGDVGFLRRTVPHLLVDQVRPFVEEEDVISSSSIRALVLAGDVERAALFLGRPHCLIGTIVAGEQRGRKIGFPTANVETGDELVPCGGVYAVRARINRRAPWRDAVANLGVRPTFGGGGRFLIEVHLIDFRGDLYGDELQVSFISRLRDEQRFEGRDALSLQLRQDVADARALLQP